MIITTKSIYRAQSVIGHEKQWEFLKQGAESGKLSHAYLFSGQEKLGKKTIALEFIKFLFGQNLSNPPHPDFILIEPINKDIQISQIRDLSWKLSLKPFSVPIKSAIINQAHLMNPEAQNCFLKTLEEPKGKTLLILISDSPERLFPTILSRVQKIKFYPVKKIEIEEYLKNRGFSKKDSEEIAKLSLGKPGIAVDFALSPKKLENQQKKIKELIKISNSDLASRFRYTKDLSRNSQDLKETLDIWLNYFRNILISTVNSPVSPAPSKEGAGFGWSNQSQKYSLNKNLPCSARQNLDYSVNKLKNILRCIQTTGFLISTTNVNPRLALEILMLEL